MGPRILYCWLMSQLTSLVELFYQQLWNQKNFEIAGRILADQVEFKGSLGSTLVGRDKVCEYIESVTTALDNYTCEIQQLVVEDNKAAAKVLFNGIHVGYFMGYKPTGKEVEWIGAAFFESKDGKLTNIWVLGDLEGLRSKLDQNKL